MDSQHVEPVFDAKAIIHPQMLGLPVFAMEAWCYETKRNFEPALGLSQMLVVEMGGSLYYFGETVN